jgi:antitoxin CptB
MDNRRMRDTIDQPPPVSEEELRRLRWQCRRGMLELDHLLARFLDLGYPDLDPNGRRAFVALLGHQDQDLSDWFMGRRIPDDPETAATIAMVREVAGEPARGGPRPGVA